MNRIKFKVGTLAVAVCLPVSAVAQDQTPSDIWQEFKSPVTTPAKYVLAGGVMLTSLLLISRHQTVDPLQEELSTNQPLGEASTYGDWAGRMVPNAIYAIGMAGYGFYQQQPTSMQRSLLMVKSSLYAGLTTQLLKHTVREPRPHNQDNLTSFPSGHAATAFAFASVASWRQPWYVSIPAYLLASFVAVSRLNDNVHYLHDVVAGATIGMAYGIGLSHQYAQTQSGTKTADVVIHPVMVDNQSGIGISWRF